MRKLWAIETAYDSGEAVSGRWEDLIHAFAERNWSRVYAMGEKYFAAAASSEEKTFVLQWLMAATEMEYKIPLREKYFNFWEQIPDWYQSEYCRYLHAYQEGLTAFFKTYLREAELHFQQALEHAKECDYERGQMRAYFHQGLVKRDLHLYSQAMEYFTLASMLAEARGASKYLARIQNEKNALQKNTAPNTWAEKKAHLEKMLLQGEIDQARRQLAEMERVRRQEKIGRRRENLLSYLSLIAHARGKKIITKLLDAKIKDRVLRLQWLSLRTRIFGGTPELQAEIVYLERALGVNTLVKQMGLNSTDIIICGKHLVELKDQDVQKLVQVLWHSEKPLAKAEIVAAVWGLDYDPVVHDAKLYKLLHRARKFFGNKDLFINHYGMYSISRGTQRRSA